MSNPQQSQHTPTPFPLYVDATNGSVSLMHETDGQFGYGLLLVANVYGYTRDIAMEHAESIRVACNAYEANQRELANNQRTIAELTEALDMAEAMAINLRSELLRGKVISGPVVAENLWLHAQKIRAALARAKEASK